MKKFLFLGLALLAPCAAFAAESEKPKPFHRSTWEIPGFLTADLGATIPLSPGLLPATGLYKLQFESYFLLPRLPIGLYISESLDFYPHRRALLVSLDERRRFSYLGWQSGIGLGGYAFDRRTPKGIGWTMMMAGAFIVGYAPSTVDFADLLGRDGTFGFFIGASLTMRFSYFFHQSVGVTFGPSLGYRNYLQVFGSADRHELYAGFALGFSFSRDMWARRKRLAEKKAAE